MQRFENKFALVTGGTSGIGKATTQEFIENGAQVIITGRYKDTLEKTVNELGPGVKGIVSDAGKMADLLALGKKVAAITAKIDVLFVNAGFGKYATIENADEAHIDELFNVLVKGSLFTVQQTLPLMERGSAVVLNTSIVTEIGMPGSSVYSACKAAVQSFVKTFASDLAPKGIRVNAVSPGPISTNYFDRSNLSNEQVESLAKDVLKQVPLARFGEASEVAKAVCFLASNEASYIHGTEIFVDGGFPKVRV